MDNENFEKCMERTMRNLAEKLIEVLTDLCEQIRKILEKKRNSVKETRFEFVRMVSRKYTEPIRRIRQTARSNC